MGMDRRVSLKMSFVPNIWKFAFQKDKPACLTQFGVDCGLPWSTALNMRRYDCKIEAVSSSSSGRITESKFQFLAAQRPWQRDPQNGSIRYKE